MERKVGSQPLCSHLSRRRNWREAAARRAAPCRNREAVSPCRYPHSAQVHRSCSPREAPLPHRFSTGVASTLPSGTTPLEAPLPHRVSIGIASNLPSGTTPHSATVGQPLPSHTPSVSWMRTTVSVLRSNRVYIQWE